MTNPTRIRATATAKITHRGRPELTALLLIEDLGAAAALVLVARELNAARKARSQLRFRFWAEVRDKIAHPPQKLSLGAERLGASAPL